MKKDDDKTVEQILIDLDHISGDYSSTNPAHNFMQLITAIGKHANIQRLVKESTDRQTQRIEWLTWFVAALTLVATVATIISACK